MASVYDSIKSAADLVKLVRRCGLSTDIDDTNRAADIFGNSAIDDLEELANNHETRNTFYFIATHVWHWEDAFRFWNQHTNPEHERLKKAETYMRFHERRDEALLEELQRKDEEIMRLKAKLYDLTVGK